MCETGGRKRYRLPMRPATYQATAMRNVPTTSSSASSPTARKPIDPTVSGVFYALGAFLMWGGLSLLFRALQPATPLEILSHRVVWSLLLMIAVVLVMRNPHAVPRAVSSRRQLGIYLVTTGLITTNWLIFIWAVNSGHIVQTSLGYYINPVVNVILGVLFLGERLNRNQWISIFLAILGVTSLVVNLGTLPWVSRTLAVTYGFYALIRKKEGIDPLIGLLIETALLTPFALSYLLWIGAAGAGLVSLLVPRLAILLGVGGGVLGMSPHFFYFSPPRPALCALLARP